VTGATLLLAIRSAIGYVSATWKGRAALLHYFRAFGLGSNTRKGKNRLYWVDELCTAHPSAPRRLAVFPREGFHWMDATNPQRCFRVRVRRSPLASYPFTIQVARTSIPQGHSSSDAEVSLISFIRAERNKTRRQPNPQPHITLLSSLYPHPPRDFSL
jgi:hypothetical protein